MKRFLIKVSVFFIILFVIDNSLGYAFAYMSKKSRGGDIAHHNYITNDLRDDIIIFGSSRAVNGYNPQIISDSLQMSCYNCGEESQGIILFYSWWSIIKDHRMPKIILYDVNEAFDLYEGEDNHKYLLWLKTCYEHDAVKDVFNDIDRTEKYKMISRMYRYNSKFHEIVADYFLPIYNDASKGFVPLEGNMDSLKIKSNTNENERMIDAVKYKYLNKLIDECKYYDVKLIFIYSPIWYGYNTEELSTTINICNKKNIPFINYANNPKYVHANRYFKDGVHLNAYGADEFTLDLIEELKNRGIR